MAFEYISRILDWFIKCLIYFIPVLLTLARYNSFIVEEKKSVVDIIVDEQFCVIPFCLTLESMIELLRKWQEFSQAMKAIGIVIFIYLFIIAMLLVLLYWDITLANIQKNTDKRMELLLLDGKKKSMKFIIFASTTVFLLSFCVNVLF